MSILDMRRNPLRKTKMKTLNGRRSLILRLHHQGFTNKVIAGKLCAMGITCTPQNVSDIINSPLGEEKLLDLAIRTDEEVVKKSASFDEKIDELLPAALNNIKTAIVTHRVGSQGVKAADVLSLSKHILDIKGYSPVRRVAATVEHEHVVMGNIIQQIKERADKLKDGKDVIEAEFTVEAGTPLEEASSYIYNYAHSVILAKEKEPDEDALLEDSFEDTLSEALGL